MRMAKDAALGMVRVMFLAMYFCAKCSLYDQQNWLHESNPSILHRDMKPQNLLVQVHDSLKPSRKANQCQNSNLKD